jgi:hypothetical protein
MFSFSFGESDPLTIEDVKKPTPKPAVTECLMNLRRVGLFSLRLDLFIVLAPSRGRTAKTL